MKVQTIKNITFGEATIACSKTPEYEAYWKAEEAYNKAKKAKDEAWEAVKKTPEYKDMEKAHEAYKKTFEFGVVNPRRGN